MLNAYLHYPVSNFFGLCCDFISSKVNAIPLKSPKLARSLPHSAVMVPAFPTMCIDLGHHLKVGHSPGETDMGPQPWPFS